MRSETGYRGVSPEGAFAAVAAGSTGGAGVLAEVVVTRDGLSAEVAHEAAAPARHSVAALRLDEAGPALDALPHPSCCHSLLAAAQGNNNNALVQIRKGRTHKEQRKLLYRCVSDHIV